MGLGGEGREGEGKGGKGREGEGKGGGCIILKHLELF